MLVSEFDAFVKRTDQSQGRTRSEQLDIATYGLAAEVGSVVASIKKRLKSDGGASTWNLPNDEIVEELGDVMWYCFALARIENEKHINIFAHDINKLLRELKGSTEKARQIRSIIGNARTEDFLKAAEEFPRRTRSMTFEDYQKVAMLTARSDGRVLAEVCVAVLWQLSAQLFRRKLPPSEQRLNRDVADDPVNDVLGEIAWHVSALASVFGLKLSDVANYNIEKASGRWDRSAPTPLHDEGREVVEKIPRKFEVSFITIAKGRARMYLNGRRLGDELTDNSYNDDGYRYHDIMHLSNAAKLGWSPVLRSLLGRKRKSSPKLDEVEDGARARIVEEAIIKAIHSEGERLAKLRGDGDQDGPRPLFINSGEISFRFLKFIQSMVIDLEVWNNHLWEWEEAILRGFGIYQALRCEGQGTVVVDLEMRHIDFVPQVCIDLKGTVAGLGTAWVPTGLSGRGCRKDLTTRELMVSAQAKGSVQRLAAQKRAVLSSLGLTSPEKIDLMNLDITHWGGEDRISVKAGGLVQEAMWARNVVSFRTSFAKASGGVLCTAIALADS